jgi:ATP-binding cassette subfamily F protein uup
MDKVVDHLFVFHGNANVQDFPGNYTDFRIWREEKERLELQEKQNREKPKEKSETKVKSSDCRPRRLTFKEKREFEELEKEIEMLEAEKAEIEAALSSGELQGSDLIEKSNRIGALMSELDEKTMRWLELSELA